MKRKQPLFKFKYSVALAASALGLSARADTTKMEIQLNPETKDTVIRDVLNAHTPEAIGRAHMALELMRADATVRTSYYYQSNPHARTLVYQEAIKKAQGEAGLDPWSGSWSETSSKALVAAVAAGLGGGGGKAGAALGSIGAGGQVMADKWISDFYKRKDEQTKDQIAKRFTRDEVIQLNQLFESYIKKQPQFKDVLEPFNVGFYKYPASTDPQVRQSKQHEQTLAGQTRLEKKLSAMMKDNRLTAEEMKEFEAEVTAQLGDVRNNMKSLVDFLKTGKAPSREEIEQLQYQQRRENVTGVFSAMSIFASLTGDPKASQTFNKLSDLSGALMDMHRLGLNGFKADPVKMVNLYLFAASVVMDLASNGMSSEQAIMENLRQISLQLKELREEMHARFDGLERRMDHYFYRTLVDLNRIQESQRSILASIRLLHSDVEALRGSMNKGFYTLGKQSLNIYSTKCQSIGTNGKPVNISSVEKANECFGQALFFANGGLSGVLAESESGFNREYFKKLADRVSNDVGGLSDLAIYPPSHFKEGTLLVTELMQRNPKYASIALNGTWENAAGNPAKYSQLLQQGEALESFYENLALEKKSWGKGYELRTKTISGLLETYKSQVKSIVRTVERKSETLRGGNLPDPELKWSKGGPNLAETANRMSFPLGKLGLCSNVGVNLGSMAETNFEFVNDRNIRAESLKRFVPERMGLNAQFLSFVPASVQWADLARAEIFNGKLEVSACISQADIQQIWLSSDYLGQGPNRAVVTLALAIDISVKYSKLNGEVRQFKIARIAGTNSSESHMFDPYFVAHGLLGMAWNGTAEGIGENRLHTIGPKGGRQPRMNPDMIHGGGGGFYEPSFDRVRSEPQRLFAGPNGTFGIAANPNQFLKVVADKEAHEGLQAFEKEFAEMLDRKKSDIYKETFLEIENERREISSTLWQLSYLLREGLDMKHPKAREFYQDLFGGLLPSADTVLVLAIEKSPEPAQQALEKGIAKAEEKLKALKDVEDLRPAPNMIKPYVDILKFQKQGGGKSWWKIWQQ